VGEDRHRAGLRALATITPPPDLFLLDDGFSHVALARDLDLLAFPTHRPWGNGRLLPFGSLREPIAAVRAAHAAILTGVEGNPTGAGGALADRLRPFGFTGPGFAAGVTATLDRQPPSTRVVLATGVALPERVLATAGGVGLDVVEHLAFGDHHRFPARSLERIERALTRTGACGVVVTSKDFAKIEGRVATPLYELRIDAVLEPAFWRWLEQTLAAIPAP